MASEKGNFSSLLPFVKWKITVPTSSSWLSTFLIQAKKYSERRLLFSIFYGIFTATSPTSHTCNECFKSPPRRYCVFGSCFPLAQHVRGQKIWTISHKIITGEKCNLTSVARRLALTCLLRVAVFFLFREKLNTQIRSSSSSCFVVERKFHFKIPLKVRQQLWSETMIPLCSQMIQNKQRISAHEPLFT